MEEKLLEGIASALGTDAGSLQELVDPESDDFSKLTEHLKASVQEKIKEAKVAGKQEAYGRAKREVLEQTEKELAEKYGVDQSPVNELVEKIIQEKAEKVKADPKDIRNSDVYIQDIQAERQKVKEIEEKFEAERQKFERDQTLSVARAKTHEIFANSDFALPEDEAIKANQLKLFFQSIENDPTIQIKQEGEKLLVHDKDGNPLRDSMMNELDYEGLVKQRAKSVFQVKKDPGRQSPGEKPKPGKGGGDADDIKVPEFKTKNEFWRLLNSPDLNTNQKKKLSEVYKQKEEAGEIVDE